MFQSLEDEYDEQVNRVKNEVLGILDQHGPCRVVKIAWILSELNIETFTENGMYSVLERIPEIVNVRGEWRRR